MNGSRLAAAVVRALLWVLGLAVVALAALAAVWAGLNLEDDPPRPRPQALAVPAPQVADARNGAYAIVGLRAAGGRDADAAGRAVWKAEEAHAARPAGEREAQGRNHRSRTDELLGTPLPNAAPPLACDAQQGPCDTRWLAEPEALASQRSAAAAFGTRCERLVDGRFEFEELLPPRLALDAPLMPWAGTVQCSAWFRSGAMLALAQGRRDEALVQLRRAERWQRTLAAGARTLVGQMVSTRLARQNYDSIAMAAIREPALAEAMTPWVSGPLDTRIGARRWIVHEAQFQHVALDTVAAEGCAAHLALAGGDLAQSLAYGAGTLVDALCRRRIGFHPELSKHKSDALWLRQLHSLENPWPVVLAGAAAEHRARAQRGALPLVWRNTFGELMVAEVGAHLGPYYARHADQELHREATALVLAIQRQRVEPRHRAEWARRQGGFSEDLRDRTRWADDGRSFTVRSWLAEYPASGYDERRDAIRFSWN